MPITVVCGTDRGWRLACGQSLRAAQHTVRMASSAAEVAKAVRESPGGEIVAEQSAQQWLPPSVELARVIWREALEDGARTAARLLERREP